MVGWLTPTVPRACSDSGTPDPPPTGKRAKGQVLQPLANLLQVQTGVGARDGSALSLSGYKTRPPRRQSSMRPDILGAQA